MGVNGIIEHLLSLYIYVSKILTAEHHYAAGYIRTPLNVFLIL